MTNENINKISAYLLAYLRDKTSQEGMSQNKYAKITGVKQGTINGFLNTSDKRPRPISGASLDLVLRLFPELQRPILDALASRGGTAIHQEANGNTNSRITQTATVPPSGGAASSEALRAKIILSILDLELTPEVQSQVLKVIKNA